MQATPQRTLPSHLTVVVMLSQLFERLDASPVAVDADQYRLVARRLADALAAVQPDVAFEAVLSRFPATAEIYENLTYAHAGLSRAPLEQSLNTELSATRLIAQAARIAQDRPDEDKSPKV